MASSLHNQNDLSLQQLVPVHQSLIQACITPLGISDVTSFTNNNNNEAPCNISSLENAISSLPNTQDQALAQDLLDNGSQAQQLLLLQYLIYVCNIISEDKKQDSLQALATLVLPFLRRSTQQTTTRTNELQQALLRAVFFQTNNKELMSLTSSSLQACVQAMHDIEDDARQWTLIGRIFAVLHAVVQDTTIDMQEELTNYVYSTVLQGIQQATVSPDYLLILNPIVTWLLPLFTMQDDDDNNNKQSNAVQINDLFACLMEHVVVDIQNQQVALVVSAVLCSILPSIIMMRTTTMEVPVVSRVKS